MHDMISIPEVVTYGSYYAPCLKDQFFSKLLSNTLRNYIALNSGGSVIY